MMWFWFVHMCHLAILWIVKYIIIWNHDLTSSTSGCNFEIHCNRELDFHIVLFPQTHIGIKGVIRSSEGQAIADAEVSVTDLSSDERIDHNILSREYSVVSEFSPQ